MIGLYVRCSAANRALQLAAVARVEEDLPRPEDALAQLEPDLAELLLGGEPFGVRLEVPPQVSPAELATGERQVRICPPAIGGDDRLRVGEQVLGVILVAVGGDLKEGVAMSERAPQRAPLTGGAPAGLIHVQRLCASARARADRHGARSSACAARARIASTVPELMRRRTALRMNSTASSRETRLRTDSVATAACRRGPKELFATSLGQLRARARSALRTAQPLRAVLDHPDRDRWQLFDLVARRLAHGARSSLSRRHVRSGSARASAR